MGKREEPCNLEIVCPPKEDFPLFGRTFFPVFQPDMLLLHRKEEESAACLC